VNVEQDLFTDQRSRNVAVRNSSVYVAALRACFQAHWQSRRRRLAVPKTLSALRLLAYPHQLRKLQERGFFLDLLGSDSLPGRDPFAFFTHKNYVATNFSDNERVDAWIDHYDYESRTRTPDYLQRVYRGGGLRLWFAEIEQHLVEITLIRSDDRRNEGELTLALTVDGVLLRRLSYSYVRRNSGGMSDEVAIVIARNQANYGVSAAQFQECFPQNSPTYFCLAALCGVASADGLTHVMAVADEAQVVYEPQYAAGFANSYSGLWRKLGGRELGPHAFEMSVPILPLPTDKVPCKHRARAKARRRNWADIRQQAQKAIAECRTELATRG
jgi:uncharacterized protein